MGVPNLWLFKTWALAVFLMPVTLAGQMTSIPSDDLDPTRHIVDHKLERDQHLALPEEYIWTKADATPAHLVVTDGLAVKAGSDGELAPHYFRKVFQIAHVPKIATLYVAGPRSARIYVNGREVCHFDLSYRRMRVVATDVAQALVEGKNTIAIEGVRGPSVSADKPSRYTAQMASGKILLVKLLPLGRGKMSAPMLISDASWKASLTANVGWEQSNFDDSAWPNADSLGSPDSAIDFLQWNADAGIYDWPGYNGISPFLGHYRLQASAVTQVFDGLGKIENVEALKSDIDSTTGTKLRVLLPESAPDETTAPQLLIDFGREVTGRIVVDVESKADSDVVLHYGESESEAVHDPYLGPAPLHIAGGSVGYGPKSAFRYALVRFMGGHDTTFRSIHLDGIYYPVKYKGYFRSSDPLLDKLWAIGAYSAHVCMQDGIWDSSKRDRGNEIEDLEVGSRTIAAVFGDKYLVEDTLERILGPDDVTRNIDGMPGYSAFFLLTEAEYYRHAGDRQQLQKLHARLVQLMHVMAKELDNEGLYVNKSKDWPFVDWSPELNADTPEARRATHMKFYWAFREGVYLLRELGDEQNASIFGKHMAQMQTAASKHLFDDSTGAFGPRWQTNATAMLSGIVPDESYDSIWRGSFSNVGHAAFTPYVITPFYNYYLVSAMAQTGHRKEALDWVRTYWGGMAEQGATAFWEGYDPSWPKRDFHLTLQADNVAGYFVSLAHQWSSGVTPWLMEQVTGIRSTGPGYSTVSIRPDLIDLAWFEGGVPTPRGILAVSMKKHANTEIEIDLPPQTRAEVSVPVQPGTNFVLLDKAEAFGKIAEKGHRLVLILDAPGKHHIETNFTADAQKESH